MPAGGQLAGSVGEGQVCAITRAANQGVKKPQIGKREFVLENRRQFLRSSFTGGKQRR